MPDMTSLSEPASVLFMTTHEEQDLINEVTEVVLDQIQPDRIMRKRIERLEMRIREERHWIDQHGGNLAGYIARYGSKDDADHLGDGGELIYRADAAALSRCESEYEALTGRKF
jgi:hypothetical protein